MKAANLKRDDRFELRGETLTVTREARDLTDRVIAKNAAGLRVIVAGNDDVKAQGWK